jgi:hypothetical protein
LNENELSATMAIKSQMGRRFLTTVSLFMAATVNATAQDVTPPPGFLPGAPPPARITGESSGGSSNGPGFLQRFGSSAASQQASGQGDDFLIQGDREAQPPAPFSSDVPPTSPSYSGGSFIPPESHPILSAPPIYAPRFWLKAEALYWWTKSSPLPVPVITTGSTGIIGQPDTTVLIGNENIELPGRGGGRFTLGFALDHEANWALEASYFFLSSISISNFVSSDGSPGSDALFLPYFNPATGQEEATFIAQPGVFAGMAEVSLQSFVQGAEANLLANLSNSGRWRWDGVAGFRYLNLHETLTLTTDSPNVSPFPEDFFHTFDRFDVQNNFYGGQFGARATYENPWLFFNGTAKLALGGTVEIVGTSGGLFSSGGSAPGGYLAQPSNLGTQSQTQFAVIPSVDLNLGIRLSPWASVVVGYSFLYVSSVARPGDQIEHAINPSQSPLAFGPHPASSIASPALVVHDTDFWVQGLTFSLQLQY